MLVVNVAGEGDTDVEVITRVCEEFGLFIKETRVFGGKDQVRIKLPKYISAAKFSPWIIHRDLDSDAACAPELVRSMVSVSPPSLNFIVAVRQIDAWLIADRQGMASFLNVQLVNIPDRPEELRDAKAEIVDLARRAPRPLRADIVPTAESRKRTGRLYSVRMVQFIHSHWSIERAIAGGAVSLAKLVERIGRFKRTGVWAG